MEDKLEEERHRRVITSNAKYVCQFFGLTNRAPSFWSPNAFHLHVHALVAAAHCHYGVIIREMVELDKHPAALWNHSVSCLSSGKRQKRSRWYSIWALLHFQWRAEPADWWTDSPSGIQVHLYIPGKCRKILWKRSHIAGLFNPEKLNLSVSLLERVLFAEGHGWSQLCGWEH